MLPSGAVEKDAKAGFRNGILEVTLKKSQQAKKTRIEID
jgi:HSP20 family molecular chaperone IbpA